MTTKWLRMSYRPSKSARLLVMSAGRHCRVDIVFGAFWIPQTTHWRGDWYTVPSHKNTNTYLITNRSFQQAGIEYQLRYFSLFWAKFSYHQGIFAFRRWSNASVSFCQVASRGGHSVMLGSTLHQQIDVFRHRSSELSIFLVIPSMTIVEAL